MLHNSSICLYVVKYTLFVSEDKYFKWIKMQQYLRLKKDNHVSLQGEIGGTFIITLSKND